MNCDEWTKELDAVLDDDQGPAGGPWKEHGSQCGACQKAWEAALQVRELLRSLASDEPGPIPEAILERAVRIRRWSRPPIRFALAAASFAAGFAGVALGLWTGLTPSASRTAPAGDPVAEAVRFVADPASAVDLGAPALDPPIEELLARFSAEVNR